MSRPFASEMFDGVIFDVDTSPRRLSGSYDGPKRYHLARPAGVDPTRKK